MLIFQLNINNEIGKFIEKKFFLLKFWDSNLENDDDKW